jgi:hypothetical protein
MMCDEVVAVEVGQRECECECECECAGCKCNATSGPAPDSANIQKAMRAVWGLEHSLAES